MARVQNYNKLSFQNRFNFNSVDIINNLKQSSIILMQIEEVISDGPFITLKPMAVPQMKHTPISAFLSLAGLIIPFLLWEDTFLTYLLVVSPLYLVYCSKYLSVGLFLTSVFWPNVTQTNLLMRIILIMNAVYISIASNRSIKYKMTPTKVPNTDFAFLI